MDFAASEEHAALRQTVRRILLDHSPSAEVRRVMAGPTGVNPDLWTTLAALGLTAVTISECYGGAGYTPVELAIVFEEMGRALLPGPYLAGVVAAEVVRASGDKRAQRDLLPGIAAGTTMATTNLAAAPAWNLGGDGGPRTPEIPRLNVGAARDGSRYRINGVAPYVLDGHHATVVLVAARTGRGLSLFSVAGDATGVTRTALTTMDQTRRLAHLEFTNAPARLIGGDGQAAPAITAARDLAAVALAAEQLGGASACLEMAVEYAKVRLQFGRPIGSFQAIKHRCADLLVDLESARSAVYHAAQLAAEGSSERSVYAGLAKAYCSELYTRLAAENIQLHGGIGFTWEHDAHLHLKRAKSGEVLFGSPAHHRAKLAEAIGL
jgi:alkylation response protein AidB-like acyl-CoA dehydrogenase